MIAGQQFTRFEDLGLDPVALSLGPFDLKWYSLAYIAGIFMGWWYMTRLLRAPGAPMGRRHADDVVLYMTLGIILGGRVGYILFYATDMLASPVRMLRLWDGGMSFHGGLLGVIAAIWLFARNHKLQFLRVMDYIALCVPFGLFFGRLANFVNGELWGRPTDVPWAVVFPRTVAGGIDPPRHPSQLYEAGLEGIALFAVLWLLFWKTKTWRYEPGKLAGAFLLGYGLARFVVEFFREPDAHLAEFAASTGLHMGQWLTIPMIVIGLALIATAKGRRQRVEPFAGTESVA